MTTQQTEMEIVEDTTPAPYTDDSDPNRRTHIINPPMNLLIYTILGEHSTAQEIVDYARANRFMIKALCGYTFVPEHNPEKYDACDVCMEIAGHIISLDG